MDILLSGLLIKPFYDLQEFNPITRMNNNGTIFDHGQRLFYTIPKKI